MGLRSRFLSCQFGNVAVTFAIAVVPIMLAVGAGVDMLRANFARTVLQGAADAAALAGAGSEKPNKAELEKIAADYLAANGIDAAVAAVKDIKIKNNTATGAFEVSVAGSINTSFMALAGVSSLDVGAYSEVKRGSSGPLEMVLALDTTYSMTENDKIGTLKTAAGKLVQSVMATGNVKVGVVPFADYFKVGKAYKGESWLKVPADKTETWKSCDYSYPNKSGCSVQTTCYYDGIPYSCSYETCTYWGDPVESNCKTEKATYSWVGCVAARPPTHHARIDDIAVPYPGVLWDCGAPLLELTTSKTDVLNAIDALWPNGNTHIPSGLIWAWNMLTPEAPLTKALSMAEVTAKGGKKALVLMTDGANSSSPYDDGNYGLHADTPYGDGTYTDNLTATLCTKIKAEGTIVYTVLFDVTDASIAALLHDCASDAGKSFVAKDSTELVAAFGKIGTSLTQLRLIK